METLSIAAFSIKNLILKILNLNLASRTDLVFVINSISEVMSNCAQLHTSLFGVLLSILTGKGASRVIEIISVTYYLGICRGDSMLSTFGVRLIVSGRELYGIDRI